MGRKKFYSHNQADIFLNKKPFSLCFPLPSHPVPPKLRDTTSVTDAGTDFLFHLHWQRLRLVVRRAGGCPKDLSQCHVYENKTGRVKAPDPRSQYLILQSHRLRIIISPLAKRNTSE